MELLLCLLIGRLILVSAKAFLAVVCSISFLKLSCEQSWIDFLIRLGRGHHQFDFGFGNRTDKFLLHIVIGRRIGAWVSIVVLEVIIGG